MVSAEESKEEIYIAKKLIYTKRSLHLARRSWHVIGGVIMFYLYQYILSYSQAIAVIGTAWVTLLIIESGRLYSPKFNKIMIKATGNILRKSEAHRVTGSFLFICGAFLSLMLYTKSIALISLLYLSFGDPIAAIVGGQLEIPYSRFPNGKSLHGTAAAMFVCSLITNFFLQLPANNSLITPQQIQLLTLIGGLVGGGSEVLTMIPLDDNIIIPVLSGVILQTTCFYLGIDSSLISLDVLQTVS